MSFLLVSSSSLKNISFNEVFNKFGPIIRRHSEIECQLNEKNTFYARGHSKKHDRIPLTTKITCRYAKFFLVKN
jgi:hypothetical protein